jgi:uncharacterized protein involved in response to NO
MLVKSFLSKLTGDILRDKGSEKYSITKTIALASFFMLFLAICFGIYIMVKREEVDYFLIGELMFFILTLLGFKNLRPAPDYSSNNKNKKNEIAD